MSYTDDDGRNEVVAPTTMTKAGRIYIVINRFGRTKLSFVLPFAASKSGGSSSAKSSSSGKKSSAIKTMAFPKTSSKASSFGKKKSSVAEQSGGSERKKIKRADTPSTYETSESGKEDNSGMR